MIEIKMKCVECGKKLVATSHFYREGNEFTCGKCWEKPIPTKKQKMKRLTECERKTLEADLITVFSMNGIIINEVEFNKKEPKVMIKWRD